jgi:hypothetical protein
MINLTAVTASFEADHIKVKDQTSELAERETRNENILVLGVFEDQKSLKDELR